MGLIGAAGALALLSGCSSIHQPEIERVATAFEDQSQDPERRCDLLVPETLAELEESQAAPCSEVIEELSLEGGEVRSVEIWGGEAQVRLGSDTVFLTETNSGWRIVAAACRPQGGNAPYECEVEGP
jgi:hypothetical protein